MGFVTLVLWFYRERGDVELARQKGSGGSRKGTRSAHTAAWMSEAEAADGELLAPTHRL